VDVSDPEATAGQSQLDELRRIIQNDCDGFILYLTKNVTDSACVWNVEVPAALHSWDTGSVAFHPFFRNVSPSGAKLMVPHGARVAAIGGVDASEAGDDSSLLQAAHSQMANDALGAALLRWAADEEPLTIGIRTRESGTHPPTDLLLDWIQDFDSLALGDGIAGRSLRDALADTARVLGKVGTRFVRVSGPAHLSAGIAVGYTFRGPTGYRLEVTQGVSVWGAEGPKASADMRIVTQQIDPSQPDVLLIVGLSRPELIRDADTAAAALRLPVGGRVTVEPAAGASRDAVRSDEHARGIINDLTTQLMNSRARWGTRGTLHIFIASPLGFAVLLGHALNGFAPLALYEPSALGGYVRTIELT